MIAMRVILKISCIVYYTDKLEGAIADAERSFWRGGEVMMCCFAIVVVPMTSPHACDVAPEKPV